MSNLEKYGFTEMPFPLTPDAVVHHWAGRESIKQEVTDIVESARSSDTGLSEFVALHGSYGAGKSHALRYLKSHIDEHSESFRSKAIYLPSVRVTDKISFLTLYREIIRLLGDSYIIEKAKEVDTVLKNIGDKIPNALQLSREGKLTDETLKMFEPEIVPMFRLLLEISNGNTDALSFLHGQGNSPKILGFNSPINSDFEAVNCLGAFFRCLAESKENQNEVGITEANYLFLDEIEVTVEASIKESNPFFHALLQLVNKLPYNFCLIYSFTGDTALLEAIVPEALIQRHTRDYIELPELEEGEAKQFLQKQFDAYRPEGYENSNPFHPFTEEVVESVLARTIPLTPRNLFRELRKLFERATKREHLQPGEEIIQELAERILE